MSQVSSPEIEAHTLGLILDDPTIVEEIDHHFVPELFTGNRYLVATGIVSLIQASQLPDIASVSQWMRENHADRFEDMGGTEYLLNLQTSIPYSSVKIQQYVRKLSDDYRYRRLADLGERAAHFGASRFGDNPSEAVASIQKELLEIAQRDPRETTFVRLDDAVDILADTLFKRAEHPDGIPGLSSPWPQIDSITMGMHPGDVTVWAARPGVGKTLAALNISAHVALNLQEPVIFASLEMSTNDLMERLIASQTMIPFYRIRRGVLSEAEWAKVSEFTNRFRESPLYIDDNSSTTLSDLRNHCARVKAQHGRVGLVVLDYISLLANDGKHSSESRQQEVSEISRGLKILAKDMECPVLALSQLNRGLENRPNKRPTLSDLRESGSIEQDASVVIGLYRDSLYNPGTGDDGIMEAIILKNRSGARETVRLAMMQDFAKLAPLAP